MAKFAKSILPQGHSLVAVKYFTSNIKTFPHDAAAIERQNIYLQALASRGGVQIILGNYNKNKTWLPALDAECLLCSVSGEMLMKRIPQLGEGKLFGSYEFVRNGMYAFGHCFQGRPVARPVIGDAYATHGHRIAG